MQVNEEWILAYKDTQERREIGVTKPQKNRNCSFVVLYLQKIAICNTKANF